MIDTKWMPKKMKRKTLKAHAAQLGIGVKWYNRKKTIRARCSSALNGERTDLPLGVDSGGICSHD